MKIIFLNQNGAASTVCRIAAILLAISLGTATKGQESIAEKAAGEDSSEKADERKPNEIVDSSGNVVAKKLMLPEPSVRILEEVISAETSGTVLIDVNLLAKALEGRLESSPKNLILESIESVAGTEEHAYDCAARILTLSSHPLIRERASLFRSVSRQLLEEAERQLSQPQGKGGELGRPGFAIARAYEAVLSDDRNALRIYARMLGVPSQGVASRANLDDSIAVFRRSRAGSLEGGIDSAAAVQALRILEKRKAIQARQMHARELRKGLQEAAGRNN